MRPQPNLIVPPISGQIVGPIASPSRGATPVPPPSAYRFEDRDRGGERGAFAAGVAAGVATGVILGGAPAVGSSPAADCTTSSSYDALARTYVSDDGNLRSCP
jgi:hypothetical protein